MTKTGAAWRALSVAQQAVWHNYADFLVVHDSFTGKSRKKNAYNVFAGFAMKFLQVTPSGTIPITPPSKSFGGDSITLTATGSSGKVTFTASAANGAGITTELLLQPLPAPGRAPQPHNYRSKAFFTFVTGTLSTSVNVPAGFYAAGYRFVSTGTGQETEITQIPVVTVSLSLEDGKSNRKAA